MSKFQKNKIERRNTNFILLFVLLLSTTSIYSQQTTSFEKLAGKWKAYKETTDDGNDGSDITFDGTPFTINLSFIFLDENELNFIQGGVEHIVKYRIQKNKLFISNREYIIIDFSKNKMVLQEVDLFENIIYFNKIDTTH